MLASPVSIVSSRKPSNTSGGPLRERIEAELGGGGDDLVGRARCAVQAARVFRPQVVVLDLRKRRPRMVLDNGDAARGAPRAQESVPRTWRIDDPALLGGRVEQH